MTISKIIPFNVLKNNSNKVKTTKTSTQQTNNHESLKSAEIIPIETLKAMSIPFDIEYCVSQLAKFCMQENIDLDYSLIKQAILDYYVDAKKMKDIPKIGKDIVRSFEQDLNSVDYGSLLNIRNIYCDGLADDKIALKKDFLSDYSEELGEKSNEVLTPLVHIFLECIKEQKPEYDIQIIEEKNHNNQNVCKYIEIKKGNSSISLAANDFLNFALNKKFSGDIMVFFPSDDGCYDYSYTTKSGFIEKYDINSNICIGSTLENFYDTKGNPLFNIDFDMNFGPTFYLEMILEENKQQQGKIDNSILYINKSNEKTLLQLKKLIDECEEVRNLINIGFPIEMLLDCVRDGAFNINIAEAIGTIVDYSKELDINISKEYLNNIINILDSEDHYIEDDIIDLACYLIQKEYSNAQNKHELIYEILTFAKNNYNEKNIGILSKIAGFKLISFDEMKKLFEALKLFNEGKKDEALEKIDDLAEEYKDKLGSKEDIKKAYLYFFGQYLNK